MSKKLIAESYIYLINLHKQVNLHIFNVEEQHKNRKNFNERKTWTSGQQE